MKQQIKDALLCLLIAACVEFALVCLGKMIT